MNAESTGASADAFLADLRHKLRTPLNHIIGYSELLLAEIADRPDVRAGLQSVCGRAQQILLHVQQSLASDGSGSAADKVEKLRGEIELPLMAISGRLATMAGQLRGTGLQDLLRINMACITLLAFAQGEDWPVEEAESRTDMDTLERRDVETPAAVMASSRILAVDDDEANREMLSRQLNRYGHRAAAAGSGEDALKALREEEFDLVLLDVMMPGMNGVQLLQRIKASALLADIPVIMISAMDELEGAARCIEMGAEDYLLKPVDPVLLRARVHSALERKRLHQEEKERTQELERASEDLKHANEDLHSFAYAASHDLQEPLRTITMTLQHLEAQLGSQLTEEQQMLIKLAVNGAARMRNLITDLLSWSAVSSRDRVLEEVSLDSVLEETVTNLRQAIEESGASVSWNHLPPIRGDRGQFVQLFQNLVGNAIKYRSERPPEVRIRGERRLNSWIISVRDNGIGIAEEYRRIIFQPFRRLHGSDLPGTGLGLAICARIVQGYGGRIWVESRPGAGSVFYFTVTD